MWVRIPAHDIRRMNIKIDYFGNCYASWKNFLLANWQIFSKCYSHLVPLLMTGTEQWLYWFDNSSMVPDCFVKMAKLADFRFFVKKRSIPPFANSFHFSRTALRENFDPPLGLHFLHQGLSVERQMQASTIYPTTLAAMRERQRAVVVVMWSACSPSTPTILVRIVLTSIVFL